MEYKQAENYNQVKKEIEKGYHIALLYLKTLATYYDNMQGDGLNLEDKLDELGLTYTDLSDSVGLYLEPLIEYKGGDYYHKGIFYMRAITNTGIIGVAEEQIEEELCLYERFDQLEIIEFASNLETLISEILPLP